MKKKMLMLATVPSMIGQFNMRNINILLEMGYEVHAACDFTDRSVWTTERVEKLMSQLKALEVTCFQIDFSRNPLDMKRHLRSYSQTKKLLMQQDYSFVHCHTPIGGAIARLAVKKNPGMKVIYTAHGFHFYTGASKKNWLIFYPVERRLSRFTDLLITINQEDYNRARTFQAKELMYVPGVGIDSSKYAAASLDREAKRQELGVPEGKLLLTSIGELNVNKNHRLVLEALKTMPQKEKLVYAICGKGILSDELVKTAKENDIELRMLGFREDIDEILRVTDLYVFPSIREGLSVALMEAMAGGCPVVCSRIRGNVDLIEEGKGGCLVNPFDAQEMKTALSRLLEDESLRRDFGSFNRQKIKAFDKTIVDEKMREIYEKM